MRVTTYLDARLNRTAVKLNAAGASLHSAPKQVLKVLAANYKAIVDNTAVHDLEKQKCHG